MNETGGTVTHAVESTGTFGRMSTPATDERHRFADTLEAVGPDAPTLCDGWRTRDLAAHVILRERRPDAALGVVIGRLAGRTARVQAKIAARDWSQLVAQVRSGPPRWSPMRLAPVDRLVNTTEFFVHHEDVRRAADGWADGRSEGGPVRELPDHLVDDLDTALRRVARLTARSAPAGVRLEPDGGRAAVVAHDASPMVTVRGPVGELVLWMFGRQDHARVSYDGPDEAVAALRDASFGI